MAKAAEKQLSKDASLQKKVAGKNGKALVGDMPKNANIVSEDSKSTISTVASGVEKNSGRMKVILRYRSIKFQCKYRKRS